ncbi:hypothetical protein EV426DRAFT_577848 [Tirmania nivea]|nr:hypothetical protein EV426DRAFT_577848 [Tirmania nivea]
MSPSMPAVLGQSNEPPRPDEHLVGSQQPERLQTNGQHHEIALAAHNKNIHFNLGEQLSRPLPLRLKLFDLFLAPLPPRSPTRYLQRALVHDTKITNFTAQSPHREKDNPGKDDRSLNPMNGGDVPPLATPPAPSTATANHGSTNPGTPNLNHPQHDPTPLLVCSLVATGSNWRLSF